MVRSTVRDAETMMMDKEGHVLYFGQPGQK